MSIAAFAGMCDGAENDMEAASADDTTMNAIDIVRIEQWGGDEHMWVDVWTHVVACACACMLFILLYGTVNSVLMHS